VWINHLPCVLTSKGGFSSGKPWKLGFEGG